MKYSNPSGRQWGGMLLALALLLSGVNLSSYPLRALARARTRAAIGRTNVPRAAESMPAALRATQSPRSSQARQITPENHTPEPPGKIAFASDRSDNFEIYVINGDGSGLTRLTNNPADDLSPSWSPDGKKIAFVSNRDGNAEIYVMNADGSNQTRLTNNPTDDLRPAFSPNSATIAFVSNRTGNDEIFVMNADGSGQTNITNSPEADYSPTWRPDGVKLAFTSERDGNAEIYIMDANGGSQINLSNNTADDLNPSWSPGKITFQSDRDASGNGNFEVYAMSGADGSGQTRLTNNVAFDTDPARSSDGAKIAFVSTRDNNFELYLMNADGSNQLRLTSDVASDLEPSVLRTLSTAPALSNVQFTADVITVAEGAGKVTLTVTRTGDTTGTAIVDLVTTNGTASDRTDFTTASVTLRFAPGETMKTVSIFITDDAFFEEDETFTVTLSNPTGAAFNGPTTVTITVVDNDVNVPQAPRVRTAAGNIPAEIQATVDQFRADLGGANNGVGGTFGAGRREINWDGVPDQFATPNDLPANFFNSNSPRGAVFSLTGGTTPRLQVSARSGSGLLPNFSNINPGYLNTFTPFSPERLFTTVGSTGNVIDVRFFVPGTSIPAVVNGFGAVFSDVDLASTTKIQYFDASGTLLFEQSAPPPRGTLLNQTDAFVGVTFARAVVARVRLINGNSALGPNESGSVDVVVMDDFIYGEPQTVQTVPTSTNPIDETPFFVRQQYIDFLNREPDIAGFNAWVSVLNNCPDRINDPSCDRVTVSAAFARSPEFRLKAEFAIRFYIASFNRLPTYREFVYDVSNLNGATSAEVFANIARFPGDFTLREEFRTTFDALTNAAFVDRLIANAGVAISNRDQLVADLNSGTKTRAQVLREIVDNTAFAQAATNRAYVLSQYFGYLRRDPDPAGFTNFLNFLNANPSNFREVTRSFVDSIEYRARFGTP